MESLNVALNILTVVVGLGFVIFIHELGHFLLAKWNGVKVEKFSIGFDPYGLKFWSKQVGETTYVLGAIPLGGYVKMLGEAPEEAAEQSADPRAYHNKPVGARMAIISAGVTMNLIFGLACFVFAYAWGGLIETPGRIGLVVAGLPAYQAGIRTGDEIVAIDGKRNVGFQDLLRTVALSGTGQVVHLELKRPGLDRPVAIAVEPRREANLERPSIGVNPGYDLVLEPDEPFLPPPGLTEPVAPPKGGFKGEDLIVQVGPVGGELVAVSDVLGLSRVLSRYRDQPLRFVVERGSAAVKAQRGRKPSGPTAAVTLPPNRFVDFGFRLEMGPIAAIQGGSIAAKAGFRAGDQIAKVDGRADFDPMKLPTYVYDHAGQPVTFELERPKEGGGTEAVTITATPDDTPAWTEPILGLEPLEVPGLGLAYPVVPKVVAVQEGSPAARAGLKPGDVIRSLTFTAPPHGQNSRAKKPKRVTLNFDGKEAGWPYAFGMLQAPADGPFLTPPERAVELTVGDAERKVSLVPEPDPRWYHPLRGLRLEYLRRPIPPKSLSASIREGAQATAENVTSIFYMFRGLYQGRLGKENFGGPIRIAGMAYHFASSGLAPFVSFLGILNINLAVLNFLPIPPLDGGQMLFLVAEKVRSRPLPESVLSAVTIAGVVFVLGLMLFFIFQDVMLSFF